MVDAQLQTTRRRWPVGLVGLLAGLVLMVSGCSSWGGPPTDIVQQALNLRLQQTQQVIRGDTATPFSSRSVTINHTESVTITGSPAYRVTGKFTLNGRYRDRRYRQNQAPFELYLTATDEAWTLLLPETTTPDGPIGWQSIPVTPKS